MNILVISHEFPPLGGGGANACFYLTSEYAKMGHKVTIVTAGYKELEKSEKNKNICIVRVKSVRKNKEKSTFFEMLTYLCSAFLKVNSLVKKEKIDACQVFFGIPSGPIGMYLKIRYHIPYIIRFGGGDIPGTQKRFSGIYAVLAPFIKCIWKNAENLIANSEDLRYRALKFEHRYPVEVIYNGVDIQFFRRHKDIKKQNSNNEDINILFVSRLIERKGLQNIIPYMSEINKRALKRVKLTVVGDGPYRHKLEELSKKYNVSSDIYFEGYKRKEELVDYYENADIFILPSSWEGMPNVVLEAMAMGLPVIMTPCGGSKELIHGNGVVIPIEYFVEALIDLCNNDKKRIEMGKISRKLVLQNFSWEEKAKEYIKILKMYEKER